MAVIAFKKYSDKFGKIYNIFRYNLGNMQLQLRILQTTTSQTSNFFNIQLPMVATSRVYNLESITIFTDATLMLTGANFVWMQPFGGTTSVLLSPRKCHTFIRH